MAAFATLSLKKASCPNMSLKKAFAILALLAIIGFAQPAEGMESLYWWRVRYWNGKYYYVWQRKHKGWFDELDALEMESLQKAFKRTQASKNGSMTGLMMGTGGTLMWKPGLFGMTSWVLEIPRPRSCR